MKKKIKQEIIKNIIRTAFNMLFFYYSLELLFLFFLSVAKRVEFQKEGRLANLLLLIVRTF